MSRRILRPNQLYGPGGKIGVGKSSFWKHFVFRKGGDEYVSGTNIPRLRLVSLGVRCVGAIEDEVDALIEALRAERDATPTTDTPKTKQAQRRGAASGPKAP